MDSDTTLALPKPKRRRRWFFWVGISILGLVAWHFASKIAPIPAPLTSVAAVTDVIYEQVYSDAIKARAAELPPEVTILLVGLDNRLASTDNHADAIHLVTIRTKDSIGVTVTSIPRGTEVKGYNIPPDLSFLANVRALKGRKALMKAVARIARTKKIQYYAEVTFSQVMGVLELIGYKDPATALQYLRHRKSYKQGDIQRSYNQGKFIRAQIIRRADLLTGAKGDIMIRMGLGMIDTDLDLETVQALIYLLSDADALDEKHVFVEMRPKVHYGNLDSTDSPEPNEIASIVGSLIRNTGGQIDDLGRYNPYPRLHEIVSRAAAQTNPKAVIAILRPIYSQKSWLQVQERPRRREIRDSVEDLLVRAWTALKKPEKATEVHQYMMNERRAFSEVERETRHFSYGQRQGVPKSRSVDPVAARRARMDNIGQRQTHVAPQPTITPVEPVREIPKRSNTTTEHVTPPPPPPDDQPEVVNVQPEY